jgi:hypothetical protein
MNPAVGDKASINRVIGKVAAPAASGEYPSET